MVPINDLLGREAIQFKACPPHIIELIMAACPKLKRHGVHDFINKSREALFNLTRYVRPKQIVELGVREGYSTSAFSQVLEELGGRHNGTLDSFDPVWSAGFFIKENMPEDPRWVYHECTGEEGYEIFRGSYFLQKIDLLYIDTDPHTYDQTKMWLHDYWVHNVRPGGYIVLDDCSPYFQEGINPEKVPYEVSGYKLVNIGLWGVLQAIVEFVEEQNNKIEYAFSVWNHSSPGTAIIKLKEGMTIDGPVEV